MSTKTQLYIRLEKNNQFVYFQVIDLVNLMTKKYLQNHSKRMKENRVSPCDCADIHYHFNLQNVIITTGIR